MSTQKEMVFSLRELKLMPEFSKYNKDLMTALLTDPKGYTKNEALSKIKQYLKEE